MTGYLLLNAGFDLFSRIGTGMGWELKDSRPIFFQKWYTSMYANISYMYLFSFR